jgi:hypothetical protein
MDDQARRSARQHIIETLDASVRDIAEGNVHDAQAVQAEARRMLADHERTQRTARRSRSGKPTKRTRTA